MLSLVRCLLIFCIVACGSCQCFIPDPGIPAPPSAKKPATRCFSLVRPTVIPVIPDTCDILSLSNLIDIALQNSPETRQTWFQAKEAAAGVGIARGAYLPPVDLTVGYQKELFNSQLSSIVAPSTQINYGAQLSTNYLLFDFGGRNSNLRKALAALDAAQWTYDWQIQTVMIDVIQNYYNYINAVEIVKADEATVEDNLLTLDATQALKNVGIQNLSNELQARTNLIQAQLTLEKDRGSLNIAYAALVDSLGIPPDTPLCVADLPAQLEVDQVCADAASIMAAAKENRSDLMSLRASVLENRANIFVQRANLFPKLNTQWSGGKQWVNSLPPTNVYSMAFTVDYPIFNSFSDINALRQAMDQWQQAQAQLDQSELDVFLTVLTDYYQFLSNTQVLKYSYEFYEVAKKNQELTFANYLVGISTFTDLLNANESLTEARLQLASAKTNWLTSLANLSYDTGGLTVDSIDCNQKVVPSLIEAIPVDCIETPQELLNEQMD